MITHNGWDVTNIAYFYLNPLISVIPWLFPQPHDISHLLPRQQQTDDAFKPSADIVISYQFQLH